MSDDSKPPEPAHRLPHSGLADEILDKLARGELDAEPRPGQAQPPPEASRDIDRIYTFTDSLQLGEEEEEEREVFETWVEFRLGADLFALPVTQVREILRLREVTPVPHAPFPIIGVINLRGRVVPLVDLCARLGMTAAPPGQASRIVLVESQRRSIGLLVDAVERVARFAQSAVQPPAEDLAAEVRGVHAAEEQETRLLDLTAILTLRE